MIKCGVPEYDELPAVVCDIDVDALRAGYVSCKEYEKLSWWKKAVFWVFTPTKLDFDFIVFRLDIALKLHQSALVQGETQSEVKVDG